MLRPDESFVTGIDSYYFVNNVFDKTDDLKHTPIIGKFIFRSLPDNIWMLRGIIFCVSFLIVLMFGLIGELINKKYGWLAGVLLLTGIFFKVILVRLEDDLFGMFFVMIAFYFITRFNMKKEWVRDGKGYLQFNYKKYKFFNKDIVLSLLFLVLAVFTWKFAIYFLFLFLMMSRRHHAYIIACFFVVFVLFKSLIAGVMPSLIVSENIPGIGLLALAFMFIAFFKDYRVDWLDIALWFSAILTLINLKFTFLLYPILCLNFVNGFSKTKSKLEKTVLVIIVVVFFIGVALHNYIATPSDGINELIDLTQEYKLQGIKTDTYWGAGYYFIWRTGQDTNNFGMPRYNYKDKIIFTVKGDLKAEDCTLIFENSKGEIRDCRDAFIQEQ